MNRVSRCEHGFAVNSVPCPECMPQRYRFEKGDGLGEERTKFSKTRVGARIAGIVVTREYDKTYIQAECGCGKSYRTYRTTVTGCANRGKTARCPACISKIRSDAQRRLAVQGAYARQAIRDQATQEKRREKQGAAA